MIIDHPIVLAVLEGDVKTKVSTSKYTLIASYEALKNVTMLVVKVDLVSKKEQSELEKSVKHHYQKYGKVKSVKYYANGIELIQMISNN